MQENNLYETKIIVLRKISYKESSLIGQTVSSDFGRLDFIFRGDSKLTKNHSPDIDIFRELSISFRSSSSGFFTPISREIVTHFDDIVKNIDGFKSSCSISKFLLNNCHPFVNYEKTYSCFVNFLKCFNSQKNVSYPLTIIKTIFLIENGFIPMKSFYDSSDKRVTKSESFICNLLEYGFGQTDHLKVTDKDYWIKFTKWISEVCLVNGIKG